jgi:hypothetical protein
MVAEQRQDRRYQVLAALALFAIILALMRRGAAPLASLPRSRSHKGQAGTEAGKQTPQSAAGPSGFPTQGWKAVLWSAWARFNKDRILLVAAGVTFFFYSPSSRRSRPWSRFTAFSLIAALWARK